MESGAHHIFLGLWGGFSWFLPFLWGFRAFLKNVIFSHRYDPPYPPPLPPLAQWQNITLYRFTFVPTKQGKAKARIKDKNGKDSVETPIITVLSGEFHVPTSSIKVDPSSVVAGNIASATIQLRDKYKNVLSADPEELPALLEAIQVEVKNGHAQITPSELKLKGTLLGLDFEPHERGTAHLVLSLKSGPRAPLQSNEITVKAGPVDFEHCSIVLDVNTAPVNVPVSMVLTTKDRFHNITTGARAEHFVVKVQNEGEDFPAPRLLGKDKSSTAFAAQIIATKVGRCLCEVTFHPQDGSAPITRKSNEILITS